MSSSAALPSARPALPDDSDEADTTFTQCCYNYNQFLMYLLFENGLLKGTEISTRVIRRLNEVAEHSRVTFTIPSAHLQSTPFVPRAAVPWETFDPETTEEYINTFGEVIESWRRVFPSANGAYLVTSKGQDHPIRGETNLRTGLAGTLTRPLCNVIRYLNKHPFAPEALKNEDFEILDDRDAPFYQNQTARRADFVISRTTDHPVTDIITAELKAPGRDQETGQRLNENEDLGAQFKKDLKNADFLIQLKAAAKPQMDSSESSAGAGASVPITGMILSQVYGCMLHYGTSFALVTDGYFILFLTFGTTDGKLDFGKVKYHIEEYEKYRYATEGELRYRPATPLTLLLCLIAMASKDEILNRKDSVRDFMQYADSIGDTEADTEEFDSENPSYQKIRMEEIESSPGSHTVIDSTGRQQGLFCSPRCLQTLCRGGALDPGCPNFEWHRHSDKSVSSHQLTVEQVKERLVAQMDSSGQTLFAHLGFMHGGGLIGTPFRITLNSHGYTLVGKAVSNENYDRLKAESAKYDRLRRAQGEQIPVSLGIISMKRSKVTFFPGKTFQHFLLLSWVGDRFNGTESEKVRRLAQKVARQLGAYGMSHNDLHDGNLSWHPQLQRPFVMDLDLATFSRRIRANPQSANTLRTSHKGKFI